MPTTTNENTNEITENPSAAEDNTVTNTRVRNETVAKKSVVELCGLRMDKNVWLNEGLFNHHELGLQDVILRNFYERHVIGSKDARRNKTCSHQKNNYVPMFYPKISPNKDGEDYWKYCKYTLIKHKPWTGERTMSFGGNDNDKINMINLWEDYVKSVMSSGGTPPDYLQIEIDTCVLNRQLEIHETEDDIVHDYVVNHRDDLNDNLENDDWMEGVHDDNYVAEQDFDDVEDVQIRWDRNHDFS